MRGKKQPGNGHGNGNGVAAGKRERIAIVRGLRTPFARQATAYDQMSALDLGKLVVRELLARAELDPAEVELVVYGQVVPSVSAPNIAREIVLGTGMPADIQAFSVSRACATSFQAMTSAAEAMLAGQCAVAVAGGADSASDVPITVQQGARARPRGGEQGEDAGRQAQAVRPPLAARPAAGAAGGARAVDGPPHGRERREDGQGGRHRARGAGRLRPPQPRPRGQGVGQRRLRRRGDARRPTSGVRPRPSSRTTSSARTRRSRPTRSSGRRSTRATAPSPPANSSPLTDGASRAAAHDRVEGQGRSATSRSATSGPGPTRPSTRRAGCSWGRATRRPAALDAAGLELKDMAVVDMHEAFAAQVLCNVKMFGSKTFARRVARARRGHRRDRRWTGSTSTAARSPSATPSRPPGARIVTTVLNELRRRGGGLGLATGCAAGGLGAPRRPRGGRRDRAAHRHGGAGGSPLHRRAP